MPADRVESPKVEAFEKALTEYALWAVRFSLCKCDTVPCYHGTAQRDSKAAVVEAYREALKDGERLDYLIAQKLYVAEITDHYAIVFPSRGGILTTSQQGKTPREAIDRAIDAASSTTTGEKNDG